MRIVAPIIALWFLTPALSFARAALPLEGWRFQPFQSEVSHAVRTGFDLYLELPTAIECCSGTYRWNAAIPFAGRQPALYIPSIGGKYRIIVNGTERHSGSAESTIGPIVPLLESDVDQNVLNIEIQTNSPRVVFAGIWRANPLVGDFTELSTIRDEHIRERRGLPMAAALSLIILSCIFAFAFWSSAEDLREYGLLGFSVFVWSLFYLSLSGTLRDLDFAVFSRLHFPIRTMAGLGLYLQLSLNSSLRGPKNRALITVHILVGIFCLIFGLLDWPELQLSLWFASTWLLVIPLLVTTFRGRSAVEKLIVFFSWWAAAGQISNAIKLSLELMRIRYDIPYFTFSAYFPLLLTTVAKYAVDFVALHKRGKVQIELQKRISRAARFMLTLNGATFSGQRILRLSSAVLSIPLVSHSGRKKDSLLCLRILSGEDEFKFQIPATGLLRTLPASSAQSILDQLASILSANLERLRKERERRALEKKVSALFKTLDPSLYEFVSSAVASPGTIDNTLGEDRGFIFFDQKGYSSMVEGMGEERVAVLATCLGRWLAPSVAKFGARIVSFEGDAWLVEVLNLSNESREQVAIRTAELAWELSSNLDALNHELSTHRLPTVIYRFGAHFGSAAMVHLDFISAGLKNSVGDNVNVAKRIQQLAQPGHVMVSEALANLVGSSFLVRYSLERFVKGRTKAVRVFELAGKRIPSAA